MKKWMWLTVPAAVVVLALGLWGGVVFAQEPANVPPAASGNWTEMYNYCQNATGMMGAGGMMGGGGMMDMMMDMMHGGGMMNGGMMNGGGMMGR